MINKYVIYGERHSGTKFLKKIIDSFGLRQNYSCGNKHFFLPEHILLNPQHLYLSETIFFCICRNPYDWLLSFHQTPHHCGINNKKNIYNFLSKEWWSRELFLGPEILADRHLYLKRRYIDIFEMRSVKLNYLKNILPLYVEHYVFVRYEDFLQPNFTTLFLNHIRNKYNLSFNNTRQIELFNNKKLYYNKIDKRLLCYMNQRINWDIENQIGYHKASSVEQFINGS